MVKSNETAWAAIFGRVDAIVGERPAEYDAPTIANVREFLEFAKSQNLPPPDVGPGYWPTFSLTWDAPGAENLEIEVFADRLEVYRFHPGRTDIWYEPREFGAPFSPKLLAEMPRSSCRNSS